MHTTVSKMREREREGECKRERQGDGNRERMGRHKISSNTIDEHAEIETMGIGCKGKRLLLRMGKKEERWRERERQRKRDRARWREWKKEGRDVMRHCMLVKMEMGEVESKLCLIE